MSHAASSPSAVGLAEVRVGAGGLVLAIATDRPSLLPSLLDRVPAPWQRVDSLRLDRCYTLWAEKTPFRLQIDRSVTCEKADLTEVLEVFAADVAALVAAAGTARK